MGDFPKWVKSKRRRKKEKEERLNDGDNNGQAMHGARKLPGPIQIQYNRPAWIHSPLCEPDKLYILKCLIKASPILQNVNFFSLNIYIVCEGNIGEQSCVFIMFSGNRRIAGNKTENYEKVGVEMFYWTFLTTILSLSLQYLTTIL